MTSVACRAWQNRILPCHKIEFMPEFVRSILALIRVFLRSRSDTALEVLALRQQVAVLKRKRPRPTLNFRDRLFWTTLRRCWSRWSDVLVSVKPGTVIGWHRTGFRLYWRWRSRPKGGRPKITEEFASSSAVWRMRTQTGERRRSTVNSRNSASSSPKEVWLDICRKILRRNDPGKRWLAFVHNHRDVIVAFDFFTVPTVTFQLLYCFFVIEHGRRQDSPLQRDPASDRRVGHPTTA